MEKIQLGKSDLTVTPVCLGTMTFGEQVDEPTAHAIMDRAIERGIDFLDTAEMYSVPARKETYGATETIIGNWPRRTPACAKNSCSPRKWPGRPAACRGCARARA